jgi:hypothetical protein
MKKLLYAICKVLKISFAVFPLVAHARWRTPDEADAIKLKFETKVTIKKDGSSVTREKTAYKILTRNGLKDFASLSLPYNAANTKLRVIAASVVTKGKKANVNRKNIEDKPSASGTQGFDSRHRILIAYPNVEIGSIVEYETEEVVFKPTVNEHYYDNYSFGWYPSDAGQKITIESETPLRYRLGGPSGYVTVSEKKTNKYKLEAVLNRQAYFDSTGDPAPFGLHTADFPVPTLQVTTEESWASLSAKMQPEYDEALAQLLPADFKPILDSARKERGFVAQANALHAGISKTVRYMGDWRTTDKWLFPRSLKELAETKYGDCKDLSLLFAVMLKSLGYKAELAAIERDGDKYLPMEIPTHKYFDHMIVRAEDLNGKVYWLDATRQLAFSDGVWSDLAGRQVLIFRKGVGALERIPEITAEENSVEMKIDHFPSAGKEQTTHSTAKLSPLAAAGLLRLARNSSPSELREQIEKTFSGGKKIIQSKVSTFDASKDYVHGLTLTATLTVEDTPLQTSFRRNSAESRTSDLSNSILASSSAHRNSSASLTAHLPKILSENCPKAALPHQGGSH